MSNFDSENSKKPLFLDVGNSSIKGAYKKGVHWEAIHSNEIKKASDFVRWLEDYAGRFSEVVICSVRDDVKQAIFSGVKNVAFRELTNKDIPRELLDYETPDTLGIDRFLACYGATAQTQKAVVVIDAGTALTIDFMDRDNVYHGGVIAPGLFSSIEILPEIAPALPKVELEIPKTWPGKSTADSLKWGNAGFYKIAIEGILNRYEQEFHAFDLFITGGDGNLVQEMVERESKLRPFLVFDGMERLREILDKEG